MSLALKNNLLKIRAYLLKQVRSFFDTRGVMEVDTPLLSPFAPIDTHIDLFEIVGGGFLHSSPEYGMKKLLSMGCGDIYQLSHVYRKEETGYLHRPEFTLIEWYRVDTDFSTFLKEVFELLTIFLDPQSHEILPYSEAFSKALGVSYDAPLNTLLEVAHAKGIDCQEKCQTSLQNILWGCFVEPQLGKEGVTVITHYPQEQAALARIKNGFAERFEIYFKGMELGNGYHELTDPIEQKKRLEKSNQERLQMRKSALPIDSHFLEALERGIPDCYGIAVGFDRLLMLKQGASEISEVLPIDEMH